MLPDFVVFKTPLVCSVAVKYMVPFLSVLNIRKPSTKNETFLDVCFTFQTIKETHSRSFSTFGCSRAKKNYCHTAQELDPLAFFKINLIVCFYFRSFIVIWLLATFLLAKTKCAKFLTLDLPLT